MKTTPDIKSYIKDTQANILARNSTESGIWAFASDTGNIFVSDSGGWLQYNSDEVTGSTTLTHNNVDIQLPYTALGHFDATDTQSLKTTANKTVDDRSSVGEWESTDNGKYTLEATRLSQAPAYVVNGMGSGKPGVDFHNTRLTTPVRENTHTNSGDFTVFMVTRFKPAWLNGDYRTIDADRAATPTSYPDPWNDDPEWRGTNEKHPGTPSDFGLFGSCAVDDDHLSIGASLQQNVGAGHFTGWRYRYGRGGGNSINTYSDTLPFTNTYDSYKIDTTGYTEQQINSQVDSSINNVGLNWGDTMILSWRYQSGQKNTPGTVDRQIAGGAYYRISTAARGDHVLRGLSIGQGTFNETGGWMTVGEFLVFNNFIGSSDMNKIGDYLSTKWSTPWTDMT